jgi:hypothetical protein
MLRRKSWLFIIALVIPVFCASHSFAQTSDCPPNMVCLPEASAKKMIQDLDKIPALEAKDKINEQAILDLKAELENMRREFIRVSSENTQLKQQQVRDAAIIDLLLKNTKRKCYPFSICVGS